MRSLKDPIMSAIDGVSDINFIKRHDHGSPSIFFLFLFPQVEYIPQAKMASLFVVVGLVVVCKYSTKNCD